MIAVALGATLAGQAQAELINVGTLGGANTYTNGLSDDGQVIFGASRLPNNNTYAYYWKNGVIYNLGTLGGTASRANGASANGNVIVGGSFTAGNTQQHATVWSNGNVIDLGTLGGNYSEAHLVSDDGTVVVGTSTNVTNSQTQVFRWQNNAMQDIGSFGGSSTTAYSMTPNGSVIVGVSSTAGNVASHAFRWKAGNMQDLGTLGGSNSVGTAVSNNGNIVGGNSDTTGNLAQRAFIWDVGSANMTDLGTLGGTNSYLSALSADGSIAVGRADVTGDVISHAVRWQNGNIQDLGTLGGTSSAAFRMSADGSVIVGSSDTTGDVNTDWFKWTADGNMKSLSEVLDEANVDYTGWTFRAAKDRIFVSADGTVITGASQFNGADAVFIMTNTGVTTPEELQESVATIPVTAQQAQGVVTQGTSQSLLVARNAISSYFPERAQPAPASLSVTPSDDVSLNVMEPAAGGIETTEKFHRRKAIYAIGNFGVGQNNNFSSDVINGTTGVLFELEDDKVVGFGVAASDNDQETRFGGNSRSKAFGGAVLASFEPPSGWRMYGSVSAAVLDIATDRRYINGIAVDSSRGETDGFGYGVAARVGHEYEMYEGARVMPYAEVQWAHSDIDGYSETGGGFPAVVGDVSDDTVTSRVGVEISHDVTADLTVRGRGAWGHRYTDGAAVTVTSAAITQAVSAADDDKDWAEAGVGFNYRMSEKTTVSADLSARSGQTSEPAVAVTVNFVWAWN